MEEKGSPSWIPPRKIDLNLILSKSFSGLSTNFILFKNNQACATARYRETEYGIKLERFAVLKEYRGLGYGMDILLEMLEDIKELSKTKYLHAQVQVVPFYEKAGFKKIGDIFEEAQIMHYKMIKQ